MSLSRFQSLYSSSKANSKSKNHGLGKTFICRRGCNVRTATYTNEFLWEDTYHGAGDLGSLIAKIRAETKATRSKRKGTLTARKGADGQSNENDPQGDDGVPFTPRKRQKAGLTPGESLNAMGERTPQNLTTPTRRR